MRVSAVQNNSYNSSFGSKFKIASVGYPTRVNGLESVLEYGRLHEDRTFLNAMKALLNDGLNDEYTYVVSKETGNWLIMHDSKTGETTHFSLLYRTSESAGLFRDLFVNIARQKGLISGKAVNSAEIADIYEPYRYEPLFDEDINNKLQKIGFQKFSPKTEEDKEAIRSAIDYELNEIKKIDSSNIENKGKIIKSLRDEIYLKTCQQIKYEYEKLENLILSGQ